MPFRVTEREAIERGWLAPPVGVPPLPPASKQKWVPPVEERLAFPLAIVGLVAWLVGFGMGLQF